MTPKDLNPTEAGPTETGTLQSPFCGELRSKKFFMIGGVATEAAQYLDGSDACWCFHTQLPLGPDGGKVYPDRCVPGRSCYKSAL